MLTVISKLYESVMNGQMTGHFIKILEDLLCAYRKGNSCQALLSKCVDDWKLALDCKNYVGVLFTDLSKAFDCLPHSFLISKLHAYGLTLPACKLVAGYLSNRSQRVKLGDTRSNWAVNKGCSPGIHIDDNSISKASPNLDTVLSNLTYDGNNAVQCPIQMGCRLTLTNSSSWCFPVHTWMNNVSP